MDGSALFRKLSFGRSGGRGGGRNDGRGGRRAHTIDSIGAADGGFRRRTGEGGREGLGGELHGRGDERHRGTDDDVAVLQVDEGSVMGGCIGSRRERECGKEVMKTRERNDDKVHSSVMR
eukprot:GHVU01015343.1.p2 GENE.GHVU01015343.1~~GHVU01015343.1.p2  ORF type:complete len:120 (-),score=8.82 GHVU01015343.1:988-1347(-)